MLSAIVPFTARWRSCHSGACRALAAAAPGGTAATQSVATQLDYLSIDGWSPSPREVCLPGSLGFLRRHDRRRGGAPCRVYRGAHFEPSMRSGFRVRHESARPTWVGGGPWAVRPARGNSNPDGSLAGGLPRGGSAAWPPSQRRPSTFFCSERRFYGSPARHRSGSCRWCHLDQVREQDIEHLREQASGRSTEGGGRSDLAQERARLAGGQAGTTRR